MTVERSAKSPGDEDWRCADWCRDVRARLSGGLLLLFCLGSVSASAQDLIVNASLPESSLTRNEALLYFTGRLQRWPNGVPVKVFVLPDSDALHRDFVKAVLGLYPYQLRRVWDRQVYSGTGQAPVLVSSEAEMIERVASTAGGIGYTHEVPADARVRSLEVR